MAAGKNPHGRTLCLWLSGRAAHDAHLLLPEPPASSGRLRADDIRLETLNVGGGFPAQYRTPIAPMDAYGTAIARSLDRHFGRTRSQIVAEPGRYLLADAGVIETEVVLVSRRSPNEPRWVYLDCGRVGGLAEMMGEAINYRLVVPTRPAAHPRSRRSAAGRLAGRRSRPYS